MISSAPILTLSAVFDIALSLKMFCDVAVGFITGCSWCLNYFQVMGITLEFNGIIATKFLNSFAEKTSSLFKKKKQKTKHKTHKKVLW